MTGDGGGRRPAKIGDAAEALGVAPSALRYYETLGLVEPDRTSGGVRLYRPEDLDLLLVVLQLTASGSPLGRIVALCGGPSRKPNR